MGRSSSSCLKIIACGGDAADNDDVDAPEGKVSSDKRGWSFRKRSGRHRVLGNNVSSDTPPSVGKETPQVVNSDFQSPIKSTSPDEKSQLPKKEEKSTEEVSAKEHCGETKPPPVVATSENDSILKDREPDMCPPETASEIPSTPTLADSETAKAAVLLENDEKPTLAEPQVVDAIVISEVDTNLDSAESETNQSVTVSEYVGDAGVNVIVDEHAVIIIQSATRGFLARRGLVKLKSAVKLQAAIRGHLVRKSAVETLHCIRAIVKVQALVRARSSKFSDQKSKSNDARFSTVKLLKNSFARQLLESTPKLKSVNIRCDPLKPNSSAWGWLERWMSVSTSEVAQKSEPALEPEDDNQVQKTALQSDAEDTSIARFYSVNSKFITNELPEALETEENYTVHDVSVTDPQACYLSSKVEDDNLVKESALQEDAAEDLSMIRFYSVKSKFITEEVEKSLENEETQIVDDGNSIDSQSFCPISTEEMIQEVTSEKTEIQEEVAPVTVDVISNEISHPQADPTSHAETPPSESEEPKLSMKRSASEELESEGKKLMYASRKASNPAFIAAQSKFEELTSAANSDRATSLSPRDAEAESHVDTTSSVQETAKNSEEPSSIQISTSSDPKIHIGGSECGTELSISSTLDSPDRSDMGITEGQQENKYLEESSCDPTNTEGPDGETNGISGLIQTDLSSESVQQEEIHGDNDASVNQVETKITSQLEQNLETSSDLQTNIEPVSSVSPETFGMERTLEQNGYDVQIENGSGTDHQTHKLSPEASPKSHMTVSESQGTPSSQVSVKGKKNKTDKIGSNVKRSSLSLGKSSPSKPSPDSGVRSSAEHLPKDHKSGKRRNSFGSTKSDNADQEPRDSSSRNPVPSYMQATESARAKASSPRSSPDVHDKEVSIKKRHSLPGAIGRHGSPNIQRAPSQVAQGAKANGSSERKWQR